MSSTSRKRTLRRARGGGDNAEITLFVTLRLQAFSIRHALFSTLKVELFFPTNKQTQSHFYTQFRDLSSTLTIFFHSIHALFSPAPVLYFLKQLGKS